MGPPHREQEIVRKSYELESYRHQPYEVTESLPHSHAKPPHTLQVREFVVCARARLPYTCCPIHGIEPTVRA